MTLDEKCKEIAKDVIKDYSILSENMLKKEESDLLKTNWNAFLLGLIADQSVKAEMAWRLPYNLERRLGYFAFNSFISVLCSAFVFVVYNFPFLSDTKNNSSDGV